MKKLLSLVLVLGLASLASAGLSFVKTSDVSATLSSDNTLPYNVYLIVEQTGNAYQIDFTSAGNPAGTSEVGAVEEYGDGFDWILLTIASLDPARPLLAGEQLIFTIADPAIPTIVQIYNSEGDTPLSEAITLGIPEPASLALLGLGGLLLRRK